MLDDKVSNLGILAVDPEDSLLFLITCLPLYSTDEHITTASVYAGQMRC